MLTALVIAKNEEKMIETCLKSLAWVDELIVFDNGSTDQTVKIAKNFTDKVEVFEGDDFSAIRNQAVEKASNDWILFVDADERVLKPLELEIKECILSPEFSSYAIPRKNIIFGREVNYGQFWPDFVLRLFKKEVFKGYKGRIHEYPEVSGPTGYFKHPLLHLTHRDIDQIVGKIMEWSKIDARLRLEASHPKMSSWRFLRILFGELINQGIVKRGFLSGSVGTVDALLQTFSLLVSYIRLWQMQQIKPLNEIYTEIDHNLQKSSFQKFTD